MRILALFSLITLTAVGCSNELATGYKPKALGVNSETRNAYYAPPFSPESQAARGGDSADLKMRRPTGY